MVSVLEHNVLVIDVGRDGPVLNGYKQPVGSVSPGRGRQLELRELDGTTALTVGEAVNRGRRFHRFRGHPVTDESGQTVGFATSWIGYSCEDETVLYNSGLPHSRMGSDGRRSRAPEAELARVERLSNTPGKPSTTFTRFNSDRLGFEFVTEAADLRCLVIAVAFIDHLSRFDE